MTIPVRASGLALLVMAGAVLVGAQVVSRSQPVEAPAASPVASPAVAGPAPSNVVNIDSFNFPSSNEFGEVPVRTVAPLVVYEVPLGRWLIITDCELAQAGNFVLVEDSGSTLTAKRGPYFNIGGAPAYHSSVGLTFAPGSKVAILNTLASDQPVMFTLTGYLVRE